MSDENLVIFWHRRDLRRQDNTGLYSALDSESVVMPVFIFDTSILDKLEDNNDARVTFIHQQVQELDEFYRGKGSRLFCYYGQPEEIFKEILSEQKVTAVYTNEDYEPYARERDASVKSLLQSRNVDFRSFKDHVIMGPEEVLKDDGDPYKVYTPYMKKWRGQLSNSHLETHPSAGYFTNFLQDETGNSIPTLSEMGFTKSTVPIPSTGFGDGPMSMYAEKRNYPGEEGTSHLGIHLRFGTISIRELAARALDLSEVFLNELIWREFYQMILWHFPRVVDENFHRKYDALEWRNNEQEFEAWCKGQTGYPIVDAGMHQLNESGYMHNRVRMIVASFLTKHLLIDWRWGEAYFAKKLLDYELASNNGGWQWAAGTGTDAQPYFRIFNPYSQTDKFDKNREYIERWEGDSGIPPIVEHSFARQRALSAFKEAVG